MRQPGVRRTKLIDRSNDQKNISALRAHLSVRLGLSETTFEDAEVKYKKLSAGEI